MDQEVTYNWTNDRDNKKYVIKYRLNNNGIYFLIKGEKEELEKYESLFTIETLENKNNVFKNFKGNSQKCFIFIKKILDQKEFSLTIGEKDILICFKIKDIYTDEEEEISLALKKSKVETSTKLDYLLKEFIAFKEKNTKDKENLELKVTNLIKDKKNLELKVNNLIKDKENLELKVDKLIKDNENLELKVDKLIKEKDTESSKKLIFGNNSEKESAQEQFKESKIINKKADEKFIQSLFDCSKKFKMLYQSSTNGNYSENFHEYCDNKGPTITIIKTSKGRIFGGYISKNWDTSSDWKYDDKQFLFSIDLKKKIKSNSYFCHSDLGPYFDYIYSGLANITRGDDKTTNNEFALEEHFYPIEIEVYLVEDL